MSERETCLERSGFLFAHDCDQPSVNTCDGCNKPVCRRHARPMRAASADAPEVNLSKVAVHCVTCRKQGAAVDGSRARRQRDDYHDDPYWYSDTHYDDYHYYDSHDRRAFDRSSDNLQDGFESDFDGS